MKIVVETNLDFGWEIKDSEVANSRTTIRTMLQEGQVELRDVRPTIRTLLQELSREHSKGKASFIDPETNEVDPDEYLIMVNGRAWEFLADRLETELNDGDRVSILMWVELLGGG